MNRLHALLALLPALLSACGSSGPGTPRYRDASLPVDARVRDLLGRMTLEEKSWQLFMIPDDLNGDVTRYTHGIFGLQHRWRGDREPGDPSPSDSGAIARHFAERINATQRHFVENTRLGIPIIPFEEALHGVLQDGTTMFPQAIGLAATWDTALVGAVASAIAREAKSLGIRDALSPVINIATDARWGRVEETYGEDPYLTTVMALAFVRAFEQAGVVTTPKHFVANVGDGGRDSYPIEMNERLLEEVHFPPFKAAIQQGGARSIMASYNSVDGVPATASRWLLTSKLREEWGFTGVAIGDQGATGGANVLHFTSPNFATSTKQDIEAGLDVVFQSAFEHHGRLFWRAFEENMIDPAAVDLAVERVLRLKFELGLFENPYVNPDSAARWVGAAEHRALALDAARASIVLLKNGALPSPSPLPFRGGGQGERSIAVIGVDAEEARLGGYSGPGIGPVSILEGIQARVGSRGAVRYAPGPGRVSREYVPIPTSALTSESDSGRVQGLKGEYFANNRLEGPPAITRTDRQVNFGWTLNSPGRGIPYDWYSVRWTGKLVSPASGTIRLGVEGNDGYRLYLDGRLLIDNWRKQSYRTTLEPVRVEKGRAYDLRIEYFESTGNARVKLVWDAGVVSDWRDKIAEAARTARQSDVAVVVAGVEEGEFRDRVSLALPGHQEELILAVAATGKPVVVVIVGGSAVTMSRWIDSVDAVVAAWYPGDLGGQAVADVLFGNYNPAGRLPITFPMADGQLPLTYNHKPTGRGDDYLDFTGQPLFPFGFGLSYSTFEYTGFVVVPDTIGIRDSATVRVTVTNRGPFAGDEVVQLYLRDEVASVARPVTELKAFRPVRLEVGESKDVTFQLGVEQLQMLDGDLEWVVEPGTFRVMVGASSRDIRLRGKLVVR